MNVNKQGVPFLSVPEAAKVTGLSQRYLREGSKSGSVPHIMTGRKILINIPALLRQLDVTGIDKQEEPNGPDTNGQSGKEV